MKKFVYTLLMLLICSKVWAWPSETGTGVVSAQESIVRTSLEATQVLQSDTLTNLYGVTIHGGASNYSSFDSGGVLGFRNVVSSVDVTRLNKNQFTSYFMGTQNKYVRVGVSADGVYTIGTNTNINGILSVDSVKATSIDVSRILVSGNSTITSTYSTGTCSFTFSNGLLKTASC